MFRAFALARYAMLCYARKAPAWEKSQWHARGGAHAAGFVGPLDLLKCSTRTDQAAPGPP